MGVANDRSLAWNIAKDMHGHGCKFTYGAPILEKRVVPLAESVKADFTYLCDVGDDGQLAEVFEKIANHWPQIDIFVHSVAFANREDLEGKFLNTSRAGFKLAMEVSAYSLVCTTKHVAPLMTKGGSIITLSYYGAQKVVPNYNVMGVAKAALEASVRYLAYDLGEHKIRVNAISAGPVKTLAASGVKGFKEMLDEAPSKCPLKENIDGTDVGALASFLGSDWSRHITGSTLFVDSGMNIMGL